MASLSKYSFSAIDVSGTKTMASTSDQSDGRLDSDAISTDMTLSSPSAVSLRSRSLCSNHSRRTSTSTLISVNSFSLSRAVATRDPPVRRASIGHILFKSLVFVTALPRISSARSELTIIRRNAVPAPLYRQTKVLDDLLDLTRDELPSQMRRSALRLIQYSFGQMIQDIFTASTRKQFISILKELCSEELPFAIRKEGLNQFNYLVGAGASLNNKSFPLEHEDCKIVMRMLRTTELVSLQLAACTYLWLSCETFRERVHQPVSESDLRDVCVTLVDLTRHPLPIVVRRNALDWLWRFEISQDSCLSLTERQDVWASILEISGYTQSNGLLLYQHADSENDYLSGLRRLWWFSILGTWPLDMHFSKKKLRKIGADMLSLTEAPHSHEIRQQSFELIALFSNLPYWRDLYDWATWRAISAQFADFCLRDTERVNKDEVMRRVESLLANSASDDADNESLSNEKDLQLTRRMSSTAIAQYRQITAASKAVRDHCGPGTTVEASLDNLGVFILPGESLLIQKDQQAILYDRICNYAKFAQTRLIAVQAMYALLTIQEWLSGMDFAMGPPPGSD